MNNQSRAYLFAVLSVLLWSTVATAFKISLKYFNIVELLFYSSFTATLVLFLLLTFSKKLNLIKDINIKEFLELSFLGFLNPFLYYIILFKAYDLLPAQEALTLNYTWAIMVVILSIPFLKQKITIFSFIAIFISFLGVVVIATRGDVFSLSFSNPYGVILALSSSVVWAFFWILNLKNKKDTFVKLFIIFFSGFIYTAIVFVISGKIQYPDISGLLGSVYVGCFEMGITFIFWLSAIKLSTTTAKISNMIYLSPFLSLFIINMILGEKILLSTIFGLILIITGIIIQIYNTKAGSFDNQ
jgi:drug/metabolite transporter (DMT)-like permease